MINVIAFASMLSKNITQNILTKFQQSTDDFLEKVSKEHNQNIKYLKYGNETLIHTKAEKFADGSIKSITNYWEHLNQDEKEEALNLIELVKTQKEEAYKIYQYLIPLATDTLVLTKDNEVVSDEYESYAKFIGSLPEVIQNDTALLAKKEEGNNYYITEEDLDKIRVEIKKKPDMVKAFSDKFVKPEINNLISKHFALDFLVDF